jgi:hypothetical protein
MSNVRRCALTFVNQLTECAPKDIRRSLVKGLSEEIHGNGGSSWEVSGEQTGERPIRETGGQAGRADLVHLTCLVHLVCLIQPHKTNQKNQTNRPTIF